jgi:uncharacterized protein YbjT (DUF2867 family)
MRLTRRYLLIILASLACSFAHAGGHEGKGAVLVVGATGKTGKLIVPQLISEGYQVRAFVRDATKGRTVLGPDVELATGDVTIPATLEMAMLNMDYVISAVGAGGASGNNRPEKVDYEGVMNMATAAAGADIKQFVLLSSMGVTHDDHPLNRMFGNVLRWKAKGEQALRDSGVPYTIVRPGGLINTPGGEARVIAVQGDPIMDAARIPRADVAEVCVKALSEAGARNRTFEIFTEDGAAVTDWTAFFADLQPDMPAAPAAPAALNVE